MGKGDAAAACSVLACSFADRTKNDCACVRGAAAAAAAAVLTILGEEAGQKEELAARFAIFTRIRDTYFLSHFMLNQHNL